MTTPVTAPIMTGAEGLPMVAVVAADGARAEVYLHGAHLTSWVPAGGNERIFLSARSEFAPGQAIRGGVPIIFPQFDREGPLPRHGFARVSEWELVSPPSPAGSASFRLQDTPATGAIWPQAFAFTFTVRVGGPTLELTCGVRNTGERAFTFTGALHSYLRVGTLELVSVEGLGGVTFRDKVAGGVTATQPSGSMRIKGETDRVYLNAPDRIEVHEFRRGMVVEKVGFPDIVLWNPGDKGAKIADLEPGGHRHMLCVEAAAVGTPIHLDPGGEWQGSQRLSAL